jgi:hypothetical protein
MLEEVGGDGRRRFFTSPTNQWYQLIVHLADGVVAGFELHHDRMVLEYRGSRYGFYREVEQGRAGFRRAERHVAGMGLFPKREWIDLFEKTSDRLEPSLRRYVLDRIRAAPTSEE